VSTGKLARNVESWTSISRASSPALDEPGAGADPRSGVEVSYVISRFGEWARIVQPLRG